MHHMSARPRLTPIRLGLRTCLLLAAAGAAAGLGLRFAVPVKSPDAALLARVERWKTLASAPPPMRPGERALRP